MILDEADNVGLALEELKKGDIIRSEISNIVIREPIEFGHKFAIKKIKKREKIIKHGEIIGEATHDILVGEHVHVHNVRSLRATVKNKGNVH